MKKNKLMIGVAIIIVLVLIKAGLELAHDLDELGRILDTPLPENKMNK